jgi:hypothetical protein
MIDHNDAIERAELAIWAARPRNHLVYVDEHKRIVTTWPGTTLGTVESISRPYRCGFGEQISVVFRGTNGARYYGRMSADWTMAMRAHAYSFQRGDRTMANVTSILIKGLTDDLFGSADSELLEGVDVEASAEAFERAVQLAVAERFPGVQIRFAPGNGIQTDVIVHTDDAPDRDNGSSTAGMRLEEETCEAVQGIYEYVYDQGLALGGDITPQGPYGWVIACAPDAAI